LPNVDGHKPGAQVEMYSYDHDLEEFVTIGVGTVSRDGSVIQSNPGVGVVKAGWHCGSQPGGSGCCEGGNGPKCGYCQNKVGECPNASCELVPDRPQKNQVKGNCHTELCGEDEFNPGDKPEDDCGICDPETKSAIIDTSKELPPDKQDPKDCKTLMCGGGYEPADETSALKADEKTVCKVCDDGSVANEEEGALCGNGTPEQTCYTCKFGNCGNHCEANGNTRTYEMDISGTPAWVNRALDKLETTINGIPILRYSGGWSASGTVTEGEECCQDCAYPEPVDYIKSGGTVKLSGKAQVVVPGFGTALSWNGEAWGFAEWSVWVVAGLGGQVEVDAAASFESKVNECSDPSCNTISLGTNLKLDAGVIADVGGSLDLCTDEEACVNVAEISGNAFVGLTAPGFAGVKTVSDASCGSDCFGGSFGPVSAEARASAIIKLGLWKVTFNGKKSLQLTDVYGLGSAGCGS
jgi:hypothetical protein